jgi:hypothetical protein
VTGADRLGAALGGADVVAFAPLAWAGLPEFLHVEGSGAFWLDAATAQRLLGDAAGVCAADACVVPMLPRPPAAARPRPDGASAPDEIAGLPEVAATTALLRRLAAVGAVGLVADLPPLADLARMLPGAAREDLEDALTDLARAGLEAGAHAVCVRGAPDAGVADTVDAIAPLADYYAAAALGVEGARGWAAGGRCQVGVLGSDGRWPDLACGVVLTAADVTECWTPQQVRALLREPAAARRLAGARAPASTEDAR